MRFCILILLQGCDPASIILGKNPTDSVADTNADDTGSQDSETGYDTGGHTGDTGTGPIGPCNEGGWGYGSADSIIVVEGADDRVATGALDAPFGTIMAAVAYTVTASNPNILIAPGTYFENLYMPLSDYSGLTIAGCGTSETTIAGDPATEAVYWEGIVGTMEGLSIQIGENGVAVDGANITLVDVEVIDSLEYGITVFNGGALNGTNVIIDSPVSLGLDVQSGSSAQLVESEISGASIAGVRVSGGSVVFEQVTISDTNGSPGFGVYVGEGGFFAALDLTISDCFTAGVMGYDASLIGLTNATITGVVAPDTSLEARDQHADGIVMMLGGAYDPTLYALAVNGLTVTEVGRSAVIAQGVNVTELQTVVAATGYSEDDVSVFLQSGALMADTSPDSYVSVEEGSELSVSWSW